MTPRSFGRQPSERDFQRAVMELAELSGWETLHVRTSMQQGRYMTATTGTMAKGWPDLVLVHPSNRRLIFAELKSQKGRLTYEQHRIVRVLDALRPSTDPRIQVVVWRPSDWPSIETTLTRKEENPRDTAA